MDWGNLIGNYVFPVVACVYMAVEMRSMRKEFAEQLRKITVSHETETDALRETINNNTLALQHIADIMQKN